MRRWWGLALILLVLLVSRRALRKSAASLSTGNDGYGLKPALKHDDRTCASLQADAQLVQVLQRNVGWSAKSALQAYWSVTMRPTGLSRKHPAMHLQTKAEKPPERCYESAYVAVRMLGEKGGVSPPLVSYSAGPRQGAKSRQCSALKRIARPYRVRQCPLDRMCIAGEKSRPVRREHLRPRPTEFYGEVGYELVGIVPWAYELAVHSFLQRSVGVGDSWPFYFFSPAHCEVDVPRAFSSLSETTTSWPHDDGENRQLINALVTPDRFPLPRWRMPPFRAHYCGMGLTWFSGERYVVVYNKRNSREWGAAHPVNSISNNGLIALYDVLVDAGFTMVYHRGTIGMFQGDEVDAYVDARDDFDALRSHAAQRAQAGEDRGRLVLLPEFLGAMAAAERLEDYERLSAKGPTPGTAAGDGQSVPGQRCSIIAAMNHSISVPDEHSRRLAGSASSKQAHPSGQRRRVSVNELQLSVLADADGHIAVQGGPAYLSLLWGEGRPVLLYQAHGREVAFNSTAYFHHFTGSPVRSERSVPALVDAAREIFGLG